MSLLERFSSDKVRYIKPIFRADAKGLVEAVYAQLAREFQIVSPMTVHSPVPELLAAVWSAGRETLVVGQDRILKEAIASGVSQANRCPFCVDVHSVMLQAGERADVAAALASGNVEEVQDEKFRDVLQWATATLQPENALVRNPPFKSHQAVSFLGTAVVFHYLNRVVNVFMREASPLALPAGFRWMREGVARVAARTLGRSTVKKNGQAGESLKLIPEYNEQSGIKWIDSDATIGVALNRLFAVAKKGAKEVLSEPSRNLVHSHVDNWNGSPAPLGKQWLSNMLKDVPENERALVKLALLVAFAAYQVSDDDVAEFRAAKPSDEDLVRVVAWGASLAARRVASWLCVPGAAHD